VTKCETTYTYSNQASAQAQKVIGLATVHGHTSEVADGMIKGHKLKLSLLRLAKGRYHVSLLKSQGSRVFIQIGRIWIRVP
jgi:hypothetical protein